MWLCKCGVRNSGLNSKCAAETYYKAEHYQTSNNSLDELRLIVALRELNSQMTPNEELFASYYNKGKLLVSQMDDTGLREHRERLAQVATEAKAHVMAADDEIRERGAKRKLKDKENLITVDTNLDTSDAINAVKTRAARMSKMDKLKQQLLSAGLDDATVKEMISNMERKATDKNLKTVTFQKPSVETSVVQVKTAEVKSSEPFDPTKLFGAK